MKKQVISLILQLFLQHPNRWIRIGPDLIKIKYTGTHLRVEVISGNRIATLTLCGDTIKNICNKFCTGSYIQTLSPVSEFIRM